jgi:S-formylglutathione hydrolase FrmB
MALMHCNFHSTALGIASTMDVIVPQLPLTRKARAQRRLFPTLYLLHGLSDDHTIWQRRTSIERYVAPLNLAVVMPSVHRSFYTDMRHGHCYWTFISEELPHIARSLFPLSAKRRENYVAGLSMGGYGAFKLAFRKPDMFAAAASLSGALDVVRLIHGDERAKEFTDIFGEPSSVGGGPDDLFHLVSQLAASRKPKPALYQCCGTEDYLYADNRRFRNHVRALGLKLTYEEGPGDHDWGFWDAWIQRVLAWLPLKK